MLVDITSNTFCTCTATFRTPCITLSTDIVNKLELKKRGTIYTGLPGIRRDVAVPPVFWDVKRCRLTVGYRRFGTSNQCRPHELSCPGLLENTDCNVLRSVFDRVERTPRLKVTNLELIMCINL